MDGNERQSAPADADIESAPEAGREHTTSARPQTGPTAPGESSSAPGTPGNDTADAEADTADADDTIPHEVATGSPAAVDAPPPGSAGAPGAHAAPGNAPDDRDEARPDPTPHTTPGGDGQATTSVGATSSAATGAPISRDGRSSVPPPGPAPTVTTTPAAAPSPPGPPGPPGPPAYGASRSTPPKIFDLPDETRPGKPNGDGTIVLGGAAAAEGRTTGPNPRIAGPAAGVSRTPGSPVEPGAETAEERGRHFAGAESTGDGRDWWPLALAAVPVVAIVLLVAGWAVDTVALSGQVMRNVEVAGRSVGGLGEGSLPAIMDEVDAAIAERPVVVTTGDKSYETTAGDLGLRVDTEATADAALEAGRDESLLVRPLNWLSSFFSPRQVDVQYSVTETQVVAKMFELQGPELLAPHDPTIQLGEQGWVPVPGTPGQGVDTDEIVDALPSAAGDSRTGTIEIEAHSIEVAPRFTDAEAQELADSANALTANGITLTAGDTSKEVGAETLRTWIAPTTANGALELEILPDVVNAAVPELFADVSAEPVSAGFDLQGGTPVVVPATQGVTCCGPTSPQLVWDALQAGEDTVALEVTVTEPELTTEAAQGLAIVGPVGGNNAWRDGAPTTAGPGFTTYHAANQPRVTNIQRMADLVRGALILPGDTFSINDHVGPRTAAKGFVPAGAIREGEHVDEIGGGVSQFATTMFNAAYFAGLDIPVSQAHSEYFPRYPRGREATMGHPAPDLQIRNNTPHGILIWTSYTATSITVTLYSTPYATAEQTGITETMSGACKVVTTTRTRTYPDGTTDDDTFKATYRPGEGQTC